MISPKDFYSAVFIQTSIDDRFHGGVTAVKHIEEDEQTLSWPERHPRVCCASDFIFLASAYMRAGGRLSPSSSNFSTDRVRSMYSLHLSCSGGAEVSNQLSALAGI